MTLPKWGISPKFLCKMEASTLSNTSGPLHNKIRKWSFFWYTRCIYQFHSAAVNVTLLVEALMIPLPSQPYSLFFRYCDCFSSWKLIDLFLRSSGIFSLLPNNQSAIFIMTFCLRLWYKPWACESSAYATLAHTDDPFCFHNTSYFICKSCHFCSQYHTTQLLLCLRNGSFFDIFFPVHCFHSFSHRSEPTSLSKYFASCCSLNTSINVTQLGLDLQECSSKKTYS